MIIIDAQRLTQTDRHSLRDLGEGVLRLEARDCQVADRIATRDLDQRFLVATRELAVDYCLHEASYGRG
jgi:hypothetical protein